MSSLLSRQRQEQLVQLLEACASTQTLRSRLDIVARLPNKIKRHVPEAQSQRHHLTSIVERCAARPSDIHELLNAVEWFEGETEAMKGLAGFLSEHSVPARFSRSTVASPPEMATSSSHAKRSIIVATIVGVATITAAIIISKCPQGSDREYGVRKSDDMVYVHKQQFVMGDGSRANNPSHQVRLSSFYIEEHPTKSDWMTWYQASTECRKKGMQLPTEAQWELAAQTGVIVVEDDFHEWVQDWYSKEYYDDSDGNLDPSGPPRSQCTPDPGIWGKSRMKDGFTDPCCKVLRGGSLTQRSFWGAMEGGKNRGYRCVRNAIE